jgi:hypothetical protein
MRRAVLGALFLCACRSSSPPQIIVGEMDAAPADAFMVPDAPPVSYPGLVGYWRLDEGGGTLAMDSSPSAAPGALAGGALFISGGFGKARFANPGALALDGVDGKVTLDPRRLPPPQAPKTISLWMSYIAYPPGTRDLVSLGGADGCGLTLGLRNNRLAVWSAGGAELVSVLAPRTGWHQVSYTFDGQSHVLVLDGVVSLPTGAAPQSCALTTAVAGNNAAGNEGFEGRLDDLRIYDRALSDGELGLLAGGDEPALTAPYDGGSGLIDAVAPREAGEAGVSGPLAVGLVGYWPLDEGMGQSAADLSGSGNDGVLMGATAWVPAGFPAAKFKNPASLTLNGRPDQVVVGANRLGPVDGKLSLSLWFNYAAAPTTGNRTFFSFTNRNEACGIQLGTRGMNLVAWQWGGTVVAQTPAPPPGWHHVVYTFDGTTHALTLDGGMPVTTATPAQSCVPTDATIGNYQGGGEFFIGQLDDIRIWADRVLDAPSIAALFAGEQ